MIACYYFILTSINIFSFQMLLVVFLLQIFHSLKKEWLEWLERLECLSLINAQKENVALYTRIFFNFGGSPKLHNFFIYILGRTQKIVFYFVFKILWWIKESTYCDNQNINRLILHFSLWSITSSTVSKHLNWFWLVYSHKIFSNDGHVTMSP